MKLAPSIFKKVVAKLLSWELESKFSVRIISPGEKDRELMSQVYQLRYKVYCLEYHYLSAGNFIDGQEYDEFDAEAVHFCITYGRAKKVVGVVRLIKESNKGIPMDKEFQAQKIHDTYPRYEISRLAVASNFRHSITRNHGVLLLLLRELRRYCVQNSISIIYAAIDRNVFNLLNKIGFSFEVVGQAKLYMGSETIPIRVNIIRENEWLRIVNPAIWQILNTKKVHG